MAQTVDVIEMFKVAFGEDEYQKLLEVAAAELASELLEKSAEAEKHPTLYQETPSTLTQGTPSNKQIVSDTVDAIKKALGTGAEGVESNIKTDVTERADAIKGKAADALTSAAEKIQDKSNKIKPQEKEVVRPPASIPRTAGDFRKTEVETNKSLRFNPTNVADFKKLEANTPKTDKELFDEKINAVVGGAKDMVPTKTELADKAYSIASKGIDAASENPGAAAAIIAGTGATGLLGMGLLGRGVAKAIRKNRIPKEVVASINEEILEEIMKES
jgi:hypothetical protein